MKKQKIEVLSQLLDEFRKAMVLPFGSLDKYESREVKDFMKRAFDLGVKAGIWEEKQRVQKGWQDFNRKLNSL